MPLRIFDELELRRDPEPGVRLAIEAGDLFGASALPTDRGNLALAAAERAAEALGLEGGLALQLRKRIALAAGLGGGSSDAAAALLGVEALAGRSLGVEARQALALSLGADVPFFLDPRPAVGRGLGERLEALVDWPELWWVVVTFPFAVSTAEAYRRASAELTLPRDGSSIAALWGPGGVVPSPHNDLETVTSRLHPEIRDAQQALAAAGARTTGMSGSGPTVYGLFTDPKSKRPQGPAEAERAAQHLRLPPGATAQTTSSPASDTRDWGSGIIREST